MVLREGALALQAGSHRGGQQFRQLAEFAPRTRIMHSLPGINNEPLRAGQHGGRSLYLSRIRTKACGLYRFIIERLRYLLVPHVSWNLDYHRTASSVAQARKSAAENMGNFGGRGNRLG